LKNRPFLRNANIAGIVRTQNFAGVEEGRE